MNLAGGCISGTLFKMGQGYVASMIAFLGVAAGLGAVGLAMSVMPASGGGQAGPSVPTTVPAALGVSHLLLALVAVAASGAAFVARKKQRARTRTGCACGTQGSPSVPGTQGPNFILGGALIAVLNTALYVADGSPLGLSGLMIYIPSRTAFLINQEWASGNWMFGNFIHYPHHIMMTLMGVLFIAGALVSAVLAGRFRVRLPAGRQALSSLIGGFLMGLGVPLMWGCNVTHILGNLPQLGIGGIISTLGIVIGAWLGVKLIGWIALRHQGSAHTRDEMAWPTSESY
jgi:hypothetical protein